MTLYVGIVSHGHDALITNNDSLQTLALQPGVRVLIQDNLSSEDLRRHARVHNYEYLASGAPAGFGANNNALFQHAALQQSVTSEDYFCLFNPDVIIDPGVMHGLIEAVLQREVRFATLNLVQNEKGNVPDLNIKRFPSLLDFAEGFFFGSNPAAYDKSKITEPCMVDWASGAFLLFRVDLFKELGGFDERFFMYLEDVDICRRAREQCGEPLWYFPQFKAVHLCQQANKKLFSKHFWWFLTSMAKYFWKYRFRAPSKAASNIAS